MVGRDACAWMKVWGRGQEPVLGSGLRGYGCGLELHGGVHVPTGDMPVTGALWPGRAMWGKQDEPRQSPGQGGSGTFCSWAHGPSDQHTAAAIKSTTHPETQQAEGRGPRGPRGVGAGAAAEPLTAPITELERLDPPVQVAQASEAAAGG